MTELELQIFDLERQRWKYPAAKEGVVLRDLGLTSTRYHQLLTVLIDRPDAEAHDPQLVHRLRRLRDRRRTGRSRRSL